ncbi:uncharacterized protein LOC129749781 [Uranotaenia lowii]|uniref:uncharacterized protein LOC129749781 n=1 Tax=Uranotaenia lowii TaxID=190385 RepID=UPI00247B006C|nr:uncharacterized protein LOC129749781 [Uranotaenia lowii]
MCLIQVVKMFGQSQNSFLSFALFWVVVQIKTSNGRQYPYYGYNGGYVPTPWNSLPYSGTDDQRWQNFPSYRVLSNRRSSNSDPDQMPSGPSGASYYGGGNYGSGTGYQYQSPKGTSWADGMPINRPVSWTSSMMGQNVYWPNQVGYHGYYDGSAYDGSKTFYGPAASWMKWNGPTDPNGYYTNRRQMWMKPSMMPPMMAMRNDGYLGYDTEPASASKVTTTTTTARPEAPARPRKSKLFVANVWGRR